MHDAPADTLQLSVKGVPAVTEEELADRLTLTGAVPASAMANGAPADTTFKVPVRLPAAVGLNVTETVQLLPTARVVLQLLL
jgi:hypothetical protein